MKNILLVALFFICACSTMNREECLTTNWHDRGIDDGALGHENFTKYQRACGQEGISILSRTGEYQKGFREGLRNWCTFKNGFQEGLSGRNSTAHCEDINPSFARGFEEGFREYRFNERRKRDEEIRDKKYSQEKDDFRQRVLQRSNTKECAVDSDCHTEGVCQFNRCQHNGQACSYHYECKVKGLCREVSDRKSDGSVVSIRVCDYDRSHW